MSRSDTKRTLYAGRVDDTRAMAVFNEVLGGPIPPEETAASADECGLGGVWATAMNDEARVRRIRADPVKAAACLLLRRVMDANPLIEATLSNDAAAVVIRTPTAAWNREIFRAVRTLFLDPADHRSETTDCERVEHYADIRRGPLICTWDGSDPKKHRPTEGNFAVSSALALGRSVWGFSPVPDRYLPAALLSVVDLRIELPALDGDLLSDLVEVLTGERPLSILDGVPAALTPQMLRLAYRPGRSADAYLAGLSKLALVSRTTPGLTLDDLGGMEEAVAWGRALARDLADYKHGRLAWAEVDKGCLLHGQPGTGKTMFATALAGTCDVALVAASLAQWQSNGHLGDCLKAMRASFELAAEKAPSILFIDEIDAVGDRSKFSDRHRDYWIQVVNGLLEAVDGTAGREGVVVVGACNNPDRIDSALKRPGRLDRVMEVPLPDQRGLTAIFRHHLHGELADADLTKVTLRCLGQTGAAVEQLVRSARRRARADRRGLAMEDLIAELDTIQPLPSKKDLWRTAVHEAGHALVLMLERPGAIERAAIIGASGIVGSVTGSLESGGVLTQCELSSRLRQALAGRAAEELIFGEVSSQAGGDRGSDLAQATMLVTMATASLGIGESGGLGWLSPPDPESLLALMQLRPDIASAVEQTLGIEYRRAMDYLRRRRDELTFVAGELMRDLVVNGQKLEAALAQFRAGHDLERLTETVH